MGLRSVVEDAGRMTILFWDIDGTLLRTGGAGLIAWEDACRAVTGRAIDWGSLRTDGLTDHRIAVRILEGAGATADHSAIDDMVRRYETRLPVWLPLRQGGVLGGVRDLLLHLRANRSDVHSMLLTGNTAAGARTKLTYYDLQGFFEDGAFSEDPGPRSNIAARALAAAHERFPQVMGDLGRAFVIGDTPHDMECARAIGVRAIAVASGTYDMSALVARGAWRAFDCLPAPAAFESLIDESVEPASPVF